MNAAICCDREGQISVVKRWLATQVATAGWATNKESLTVQALGEGKVGEEPTLFQWGENQ